MLQQVQETRETVAARDAEIGELKARVAELEKLQQQQQQLIEMKDSALAAAQQDLSTAREQQPAPPPEAGPAAWPWIGLGLALLLAAVVGWLWTRRRVQPRGPRLFSAVAEPEPEPTPEPEPAPVVAEDSIEPVQAPDWTTAPALVGTVPDWSKTAAEAAVAAAERGEPLSPARQVELARAYLDLGDDTAAETLLREVLDGPDLVAREVATRMLKEL